MNQKQRERIQKSWVIRAYPGAKPKSYLKVKALFAKVLREQSPLLASSQADELPFNPVEEGKRRGLTGARLRDFVVGCKRNPGTAYGKGRRRK